MVRRNTVTVNVGGITIGSDFPVRVQSMTNTSTDDIEKSVLQCKRIADAGGEIVRLTAQGVKEAKSIGVIRQQLRSLGCNVPLVADIHFNPQAAFEAAKVTDKVRINPGNFVDPARQFKHIEYTDKQYAQELQRIEEALVPFISLCKKHDTAVRIGVNHGSLSDRIMSRYGNTAPGMVESAMEFLRVFVKYNFLNVVISMKASNVVVMVEAVRMLVEAMRQEGMNFPIHLGVTEAGFGEDGRIKSAVGIGALMMQGIGDTIRVSLSEDPENEIPVAKLLVDYVASISPYAEIIPIQRSRASQAIVIADKSCGEFNKESLCADYYSDSLNFQSLADYDGADDDNRCVVITEKDINSQYISKLKGKSRLIIIIEPINRDKAGTACKIISELNEICPGCRMIPHFLYNETETTNLQIKASADFGAVLLSGMGDGVWISNKGEAIPQQDIINCAFGILQASRLRTTHTEFISCPSCGRTLFDLQTTVQQVKSATSHLKHLKIAVMGCIVNGPGEMADADYGYVGAAPGKISLYKNKECVEKNIPQELAIERLVNLIKINNDWIEP